MNNKLYIILSQSIMLIQKEKIFELLSTWYIRRISYSVIFPLLLLFFIPISSSYSQQSRLDALGGLSYSILDMDAKVDPFILGGNPAWMVNSQLKERLEINPFANNSSGDYHRKFASGNITNYGADFKGIKPLGSSGTFFGSAGYNYQIQKDRNRALTLTPYDGSSYIFTDSTSGNFKYSGISFQFMHSLKIWEHLYFGASVNYQILDGLKEVYTFAQSLYRNVSGNIGFAYKFNDKYSLGINYIIEDNQERLEASDVNLFTVFTYLYRGEKYKVELRSSSQDFKIKKKGNIFGGQFYMNPIQKLFIGISGKLYSHNSGFFFQKGAIVDHEDGFSSFSETEVKLEGKWIENSSLVMGVTGGFSQNKSWTKNSNNNLLLWDWDYTDTFTGIGTTIGDTYRDGFLVGAELEIHFLASDSSKYIDNRFSNITASNYILRLGSEVALNNLLILRLGYNFIFKTHDFIFGGDNVIYNNISIGASIKVSKILEVDLRSYYFKTSLRDITLSTDNLGVDITLRFYEF